jgi:hypothetical protein
MVLNPAQAQVPSTEAKLDESTRQWVNVGYSPGIGARNHVSVANLGVAYYRPYKGFLAYGSAHYWAPRAGNQILLSVGGGVDHQFNLITLSLSAGPSAAYLLNDSKLAERETFSFGLLSSLKAQVPIAKDLGGFVEGMWNAATEGSGYGLNVGVSFGNF